MINVSEATKNLYKTDLAKKSIHITSPELLDLTNSDIVADSLNITEILENGRQLTFTGCNASKLEFQCADLPVDLVGRDITVTIDIEGGDSIQIFKGIVDSQSNGNHEDILTNITAYDYLYLINNVDVTSWYNGLNFPISLKSFRDSLFSYLGYTQVSTNLEFDSLYLEKTIDPQQLSAKDVLTAICTLNAVYGRMNRYGLFEYVSLDDDIETEDIEIEKSNYSNVEYENYSVQLIDKVQIRQDADDIGAIYGSGSNTYIVQGNFLVFGRNASELGNIAQRVYNKVSNYSYIPCKINCVGLPFVEVGDRILTTTAKNTIRSYVLQRSLKGIQALKDAFTAYGNETRDSQINAVNTQIIQLKGKSNQLTRDVEQTQSLIRDVEEGTTSAITQLSDNIQLQIEEIYNQLDGSINVYTIKGTPTLLNYPAWDFTYNIPCNNTVQTTDDLRFEYNDQFYRKNQRSICYDEENTISYRFVFKNDAWVWEEIADTEYTVLMKRVTELEVRSGEIEASVTEVYGDIQNLETEQTVLSSRINQTATEITAKVSKTGGQASSFAWSLTDSAFKLISGNKEVFKCDSNGITVDGYTTTAQLNATNARVGSLEADHVSVSSFNATKATVDTINANYITAAKVKADYMEVSNWTTAGTIRADRLDAETIKSKINTGSVLYLNIGLTYQSHPVAWKRIVGSNGSFYAMCRND